MYFWLIVIWIRLKISLEREYMAKKQNHSKPSLKSLCCVSMPHQILQHTTKISTKGLFKEEIQFKHGLYSQQFQKLCNLTSNILFTNDAVAVQYFSLCNVIMVYEHDLVTQTVIELKSVTIYYGCTNTQKYLFIYLVWYRHQNGHNTSNHTPENLNSQDLFQMHSIYHNTLWTWFEATITIRHYR